MGHHHLIHDPLAGRALAGGVEAVAKDDLALPVGEGDEEEEAVVARGVAELPAVEEISGEPAWGSPAVVGMTTTIMSALVVSRIDRASRSISAESAAESVPVSSMTRA